MFRTIYDEKYKQWHGPKKRPIFNPAITLGEALLKSMQVHGPKIAQIGDDSGVRLTFDDIRQRTIRAALNLLNRGYKANQVFTIVARNSENLAPIVFAALCIGCPINVMDTSFGKNEIKHMLSITKPSLVFCDADVHDKMKECLKEIGNGSKIITFDGKVGSSEQVDDLLVKAEAESTFMPTPINGTTEIAGIFCSSGTTGLPKGVSLSHAALLTTQANYEFIHSDDVLLCFSQLYWITGVMTLIWGTLFGGTRVITTEPFSCELAFRLIPQYSVTFVLNAVYQMVSMLEHNCVAQANLKSLKNYCVGGCKVPFGLLAEFNGHFPDGETHIIIGMTETAGIYASVPAKSCRKDTVGQLSYDVLAKIIDDNGNRCDVNVDGELCLKVPFEFMGYFNNGEATEQAFDAEGFFMTGDICHFDEDGDLFIVDRKKDMMKYCNYQITPSEIEAVLIQSVDIQAACVVGIPDIIAFDLPAVAVVRKTGSNITAAQVHSLVEGNLADQYKLRGGVYFMDALPATASGKVLRRKVKEILMKIHNERHVAE